MTSPKALPLLKWVGGKRRVLPHLREYLPKAYRSYHEPFFGGGALFFDQELLNAHLSDVNGELINVYQTVKTSAENLISELQGGVYVNTEESFYQIRALDRDATVFAGLTQVQRAARIIYLNRTCFNGLHRMNSKGEFNTPYGKYENPKIVDEINLKAAAELFKRTGATFSTQDYMQNLDSVEGSSNFIYLDPPYIPLTSTASFVGYAKGGFGLPQQEQLAAKAEQLDAEGNYVLLSNSDTPKTRELYKNFTLIPIGVRRSVGAAKETRVDAAELLIVGKILVDSLQHS